jgi:hypothetical protein
MKTSRTSGLPSAVVIALVFAAGPIGPAPAAQSLTYARGQNVAPAYEGWEQDADGVKYFLFGYMNRNWEQELDVPVGPDNSFNIGGADQGQPTHFLPRRNRFVFRVRVPNGFSDKDELVWTLTTNGKTEKAYATLRPDYIVDDVVKASETGALGAGTSSPEVRSNKPPAVRVEELKSRSVKVGEWVTLTADVKDDGIPKPRDFSRVAAAQARAAQQSAAATPPRNPSLGLHLSWFLYRGPGTATFDPPQVKAWEDTRAGSNSPWSPLWSAPKLPENGKVPVMVKFDAPGTYVLRCLADDGALTAGEDVTIVVVK